MKCNIHSHHLPRLFVQLFQLLCFPLFPKLSVSTTFHVIYSMIFPLNNSISSHPTTLPLFKINTPHIWRQNAIPMSLLIVCTVFTRDSTCLSLFPNSFKSSIKKKCDLSLYFLWCSLYSVLSARGTNNIIIMIIVIIIVIVIVVCFAFPSKKLYFLCKLIVLALPRVIS